MEGFQLFLLIVQIVIAVTLIILVLLQKSDGDSLSGISSGSGSMSGAISRQASASFISKTTMTLIIVFMINCLILASISNSGEKSLLKEDLEKAVQTQDSKKIDEKPTNTSPAIPDVE